MTTSKLLAVAALASLSASSTASMGASTTWTGAAGNSLWTDAANWSSGVPGTADTAIIRGLPASSPIQLAGNQSVALLQIGGDVRLAGGEISAAKIDNLEPSYSNARLRATVRVTSPALDLYGSPSGLPAAGSGLVIDGPILGDADYVIRSTNSVNLLGMVDSHAPIEVVGSLYLAGGGTLPNVSAVDTNGGKIFINNAETALSSRLNPAADLINTSAVSGYVVLSGHATQSIVERTRSISVQSGTLSLAIQSINADVRLETSSVSIAPTSVLAIQANGTTARLISDTEPTQIGGTGVTERPIVRNVMALASTTDDFAGAGPMTYDSTLHSDGKHVGFRPLRAEEYFAGFAGATPTTNVRIAGAADVSAPLAVNSLTVDRTAAITLSSDLQLNSGMMWHSAAGTAGASPTIGGSGRIRSSLPMQILASSESFGSPVLTITTAIDAPSLLIAGSGMVRLAGNNLLPQGVRVDAAGGLIVAQPGALGSGTFTISRSNIRFEGDQTIDNAIHFDQSTFAQTNFVRTGSRIGIEPGKVVTLNGPLSGGGLLNTSAGLLRINGGGSFDGTIGSQFPGSGTIEINGVYTTLDAPRTLKGEGILYGNATIPMEFMVGRISPGAKDSVGQMHIYALSGVQPAFFGTEKAVQIDLSGAAADRLVLDTNAFASGNPFALQLQLLTPPVPLQTHLIVEILNASAPRLRFANVVEGGTLSAGGMNFRVSFVGGDGNDVTLTVLPEPAALATLSLCSMVLRRLRPVAARPASRSV